jgi:hypothetical protein
MRPFRPASPAHLLTGLGLAAAFLAPGAALADSLRCDGGLVAVGDTKLDLLGKCGRPALSEQRTVDRGGAVLSGGAPRLASRVATVTVETWTYNHGPRQFVQYVTLEGGRVVAVERGGYGYDLPGADMGPAFIPRARCGHLSIHEGDRTFDLLARCGEPATRDLAVVREQVVQEAAAPRPPRPPGEPGRREKQRDHGREAPVLIQAIGASVDVEVWAYDFGPQILVRLVELEDGVVTRVDTGSHGYSR